MNPDQDSGIYTAALPGREAARLADLALDRPAGLLPADDPALEARSVEARRRERVRRAGRAVARAAVEDDRPLAVQLVRARVELLERDVRRVAGDAARIALLLGAHVDELRLARLNLVGAGLVGHPGGI